MGFSRLMEMRRSVNFFDPDNQVGEDEAKRMVSITTA
jgi:hypothetical protein